MYICLCVGISRVHHPSFTNLFPVSMKIHFYPVVLLTTALIAVAPALFAQNTTTPAAPAATPTFGLTWSGFAKLDYGVDSRQTVNLREGHFSIYPAPAANGPDGKDVNASPNSFMVAVQSRLTGKISGPDFLGGKTSGMIEGEFFGTTDGDINGFRLRHAMMKASWNKYELLLGQYWHPMFVADCYPGVYNFSTGVPFQPFSRSPQIRFTLKPTAKFNILVAILEERDFQSFGPGADNKSSVASSAYERAAVLPNAHIQAQFKTGKFLAGAGFDFKSLRPRLKNWAGNMDKTHLNSTAWIAYAKVNLTPRITWKVEGTLGGNMADQVMLGGYTETLADTTRGFDYADAKTVAAWTEISGSKGKLEWGIFAGYTQNQGIDGAKAPLGTIYGRNLNIDHITRISPRIGIKEGKMTLGLEVEYTSAQYGVTQSDLTAKTDGVDAVNNVRVMLTGIYAF